jgi:tetratricopeptide (TPR) repeat protein
MPQSDRTIDTTVEARGESLFASVSLTRRNHLQEQIDVISESIRLCFFEREFERSMRRLRRIADTECFSPFYGLVLATCLIESNNVSAALGVLNGIIADDSWNADAHYLLGLLSARKGDFQKSLDLLTLALRKDCPVSLLDSSFHSMVMKNISQVQVREANTVLFAESPYELELFRALKTVEELYWSDRLEEAMDALRKLPAITARSSTAQLLKGLIFQKLNRHKEAIECFTSILSRGISDPAVLFFRARSSFALGMGLSCIEDCNAILSNTSAIIAVQLSKTQGKLNLISIFDVLSLRAGAFEKCNDFLNALADYDKLCEHSPTSEHFCRRSKILFHLGYYRACLDDVRRAEQNGSYSNESKCLKVAALSRLGHTFQANTIMRTLLPEQLADCTKHLIGTHCSATVPECAFSNVVPLSLKETRLIGLTF